LALPIAQADDPFQKFPFQKFLDSEDVLNNNEKAVLLFYFL